MKQYRAWGEYGPQCGQIIELPIFAADSDKEAFEYAVKELEKFYEWKTIGRHNVRLQEYIAPKHDIIRL